MNSNQTNQTDHQFECSKFSRLYRGGSGSFHPCQADWIACCMCHCLHPTDTQRAGQSWWLHKTELDFGETKMEVTKHQYIYIYMYFFCTLQQAAYRLFMLGQLLATFAPAIMRLVVWRYCGRICESQLLEWCLYTSPKIWAFTIRKNTHTHTAQMPFPATSYNRAFEVTIGTGRGFALSSR